MSHRCLTAVLSMIALAPSSAVPATGQAQTVTADRWTVPLTSWGDPDLQGAWTNTTTTPLQRPAELAGKELYTDEERAELDEERARNAGRACATELVVLHRPASTREHRLLQQLLAGAGERGRSDVADRGSA